MLEMVQIRHEGIHVITFVLILLSDGSHVVSRLGVDGLGR